MANDLTSLSQAATVTVASKMSAAFTSGASDYGISSGQAADFADSLQAYEDSISEFDAAEASYRAATQAKMASKENLTDRMSELAKVAYAHAGITDAKIAAAGLQPRRTRTVTAPNDPTELLPTPGVDGSVRLRWKKNGNIRGTIYVIEGLAEGGLWTPLRAVTSTRATLSGFAPGTPYAFRVTATRSNRTSFPSNTAKIYTVPVAGAPALKAA